MNTICKKTLVIGIILLFAGVSASSAISVDTKPVISQDKSEECIECRELSNAELVKVKQLVNRVETYSKLLLVLARDNPELNDISEEFSKEISTLKDKLAEQQFLIICFILDGIANIILGIDNVLIEWIKLIEEGSLEREIAEFFYEIFYQINWPILEIIFTIGIVFGCWYVPR